MTPTCDLSLRRLSSAANEPLRAQLLIEGEQVGTIVDGAILEAQFALGPQRLVLVTHDCPYEEQLELVLLSDAFAIVDQLSVGQWYTPGIVTDVTSAAGALEFAFFGEDRWRLTVLARSVWGMPPAPFPVVTRSWRRWLSRTRLRLDRLR